MVIIPPVIMSLYPFPARWRGQSVMARAYAISRTGIERRAEYTILVSIPGSELAWVAISEVIPEDGPAPGGGPYRKPAEDRG